MKSPTEWTRHLNSWFHFWWNQMERHDFSRSLSRLLAKKLKVGCTISNIYSTASWSLWSSDNYITDNMKSTVEVNWWHRRGRKLKSTVPYSYIYLNMKSTTPFLFSHIETYFKARLGTYIFLPSATNVLSSNYRRALLQRHYHYYFLRSKLCFFAHCKFVDYPPDRHH